MLTFEQLENGNLKISLDEEGREYLEDNIEAGDKHDGYLWKKHNNVMWIDLVEVPEGNNCSYRMADQRDIGGLTDSPIIVSQADFYTDGRIELLPQSKVWWFPEYQVVDEFKELLEKGFVIFTLASN